MKTMFLGALLAILISSGSLATIESVDSSSPAAGTYVVQWQKSYGSDPGYGARYEGPTPIGDADNDGDNELLIGGRDGLLRVMEWSEAMQTYRETSRIHGPLYYWLLFKQRFGESWGGPMDPGGFAIGDVTNDGNNEVAATWYSSVHRYFAGRYWLLGFNTWIFDNDGGSADCLIGDCDNDGLNELIVTGGGPDDGSGVVVPEVVVFRWTRGHLVRVASWNDIGEGYTYYPGIGDVDGDGENELVVGTSNKVAVLNWNKETETFDTTIVEWCSGWQRHPFACICKDSDLDGSLEIHVSYWEPAISIFEWNGTGYARKFRAEWPGEGLLIEALDVGDTDGDGVPEVCAGTDDIHILQWDGTTYLEEAVITETYGDLAVLAIGDCDNDGRNEINAGAVIVDDGQDFMSWVFKYVER